MEIKNFIFSKSAALLKEICPDCSEDQDKSNLILYQKVESMYKLQALNLIKYFFKNSELNEIIVLFKKILNSLLIFSLTLKAQSVNLGSSLDVFEQIISSENKIENNSDIKNENGIVRSKEKICQKCGSIFIPEKTLVSESVERKVE